MAENWTRRRFLATGGSITAGTVLANQQAAWSALTAPADEDGHDLWLRYRLVDRVELRTAYRRALTEIVRVPGTGVLKSAEGELVRGLTGMLGTPIGVVPAPTRHGAVVIGTPESSAIVRAQVPASVLSELGGEGYVLRMARVNGFDVVVVASAGERGVLYGTFHLLRLLQTRQSLDPLDISERPANPLRMTNHWDNLDRSVERGYAGSSVFHWDTLPETPPHYTMYARALASVGINATVVNNVNANAQFLSSEMIAKLVPLADLLRSWGVTFYLSANFASPIVLGGLETADPLDPAVQAWWRNKATEIYRHIPDFGGFLVKANSEGQPGPLDYGRTHADGANLLAAAVRPYGGIVIWRAFVWHDAETWTQESYQTFTPLDGRFAENALVQIKNGPIDFQVREPVHPLFGALPRTNSVLELQITQEYTGQSTHLCYLVPQWKQVYGFDTHAKPAGATVAQIVSGQTYGYRHSGVAGVMNFGSDVNWTRHHLNAANTHGYARLAWNPGLAAETIAEEWVRMTFGSHAQLVQVLTRMMLSSWQVYESYNAPLGVGFIHGGGDHFNPCAECNEGFHKSDGSGIGFDRTVATGIGTTGFYHPPVSDTFESLADCPDELLLFFHHVPYGHRLHSGKTVIQHIYDSHFKGLDDAGVLRRLWQALRAEVDPRRYREVLERFDRQVAHARIWRDTLVSYWFARSRIFDEQRTWVQVQFTRSPLVLIDAVPNLVRLAVGNASPGELSTATAVDGPSGWTSGTRSVAVPAREVLEVSVPVRPVAAAPVHTTLRARTEAGDSEALLDTADVLTAPAGQRCLLALDAGSAGSPLFSGYSRLTPADTWDPAKGYGWVGDAPQSRDRGGPEPLLRDFVNDAPSRTLRVAVPAGSYDAYLLVGDATISAHPTYVRSGGALLAQSRFLFASEFAWIHFTLDGGAGGREVDLELSSEPGEHWHLVALSIVDPAAQVPPIVVTGVTVPPILFGGRDNAATVQVANTTAEGALSVTAHVVAPENWSAQDATGSIPAGDFAELTPTVRPDLVPAMATLQLEVGAAGQADGERQSLAVMAVPSGDQVVLALDAGTDTSPLLDGYRRLSPASTWDPAQGFGWVAGAAQARDRGGAFDVLRRDFVNDAQARALRIRVPAGVHDADVLVGDAFTSFPTVVQVDGQVVARSGILPGGDFSWLHFTLDGGPSGRDVDIQLSGEAGQQWHINALVVR